MTEEERRAAQFRADQIARYGGRAAFAASLKGDAAAAQSVRAGMAPLLPDPLDAWDVPCEPEPARPPWVGRIPGDVELPEYLKRGRGHGLD